MYPPLFFLLLLPFLSAGETYSVYIVSQVQRVIDGDTIVLQDGKVVRYLGINSPERNEPFYEEAKRENEILLKRRKIKVVLDSKYLYDKGGRLLGYVFVDSLMVNAELLRRGYAHLFCLQPFEYYPVFYRCQEEARRSNLGLWRLEAYKGPFKITTVKGNAPGDDRFDLNGEYVRICNISPTKQSLKGFRLCNSKGLCYTFPGGTLDPGYTALLFSGEGEDDLKGPQLKFYWRNPFPVWKNKGDTITLFDPQGRSISRFIFQRPQ